MKRSVLLAFALAGAAVGGAASADTYGYVVAPDAPRYVEHHDRWDHDRWNREQYAYGSSEYDPHWRREHACRAPGWDPNARYMPGQEVRRNGQLYVATEVSRHVWNVNSPPEWTPNYWRPVHCD